MITLRPRDSITALFQSAVPAVPDRAAKILCYTSEESGKVSRTAAAAAGKIRLGRKWRGWSWRSNELPRSFTEEWKLSSPAVGAVESYQPLRSLPRALSFIPSHPRPQPLVPAQRNNPQRPCAPSTEVPRNKTCFRQAGNFICLRCACSRKRTKDTSESRFNQIDRPCLIVVASGTCRRISPRPSAHPALPVGGELFYEITDISA